MHCMIQCGEIARDTSKLLVIFIMYCIHLHYHFLLLFFQFLVTAVEVAS